MTNSQPARARSQIAKRIDGRQIARHDDPRPAARKSDRPSRRSNRASAGTKDPVARRHRPRAADLRRDNGEAEMRMYLPSGSTPSASKRHDDHGPVKTMTRSSSGPKRSTPRGRRMPLREILDLEAATAPEKSAEDDDGERRSDRRRRRSATDGDADEDGEEQAKGLSLSDANGRGADAAGSGSRASTHLRLPIRSVRQASKRSGSPRARQPSERG